MDHTYADADVLGKLETWEFAMTETAQASPCVECGTTGGWVHPRGHQPVRIRNLCKRCYDRHHYHGTLATFAVQPLPSSHPAPLPALIPHLSRSHRVWGGPHRRDWCERARWEQQPTEQRWPTYGPREGAA